ncbi:MAG: SpoIIE family protein phosphatase, partial [Bacteroidia bacterium]|nr:SpoIIE family protein phosphatase [Bacteroidia bacterium]
IFWAVVDCTGHGVPGAMLSILGINLLQTLIVENKIQDTSEILNKLHLNILQRLRQNELSPSADSMDIALCSYDLTHRILNFSGANRSLYLIQNDCIQEIKGNSHAVGSSIIEEKHENYTFTSHSILLNPGDEIYIFSDGITDQFGGPLNKKFSKRRLLHFLKKHQGKPQRDTKFLLEKEIQEWKGENEQTDDILIIGVTIN